MRDGDGSEPVVRRTGNSKTNWHEESDKVIYYFERGPFLSTKQLPGPRGKNEGVPSGDGQRAYEKILVSREVRRELEGVWKKACGRERGERRGRERRGYGSVLMILSMGGSG